MGKLLLLFIIVPAVELVLLIEVGSRIGTVSTLGLIVVTGIMGSYLARLEGIAVLRHMQEEIKHGRLPAGTVVDGVMILVAGALLITPGILTDVFGFLLLFPAFRSFVKALVVKSIKRAATAGQLRVQVSGLNSSASSHRGPIYDVKPSEHDTH